MALIASNWQVSGRPIVVPAQKHAFELVQQLKVSALFM